MLEGDIINQEQYGENVLAFLETLNLPDVISDDDSGNFIHPTAIIGKMVKLGKGNYIGVNCYIVGNTSIGDNNHFEAFVSIGSFPEHKEYFNKKEIKGVEIGNNNVFREFVTVNSGCTQNTIISNNCWLLKGSHVGHDSLIEDDVTLSCSALIGGYSIIMQGANMGLGAICHQFSLIGAHAMIGMGCIIPKKTQIQPFMVYVGNPAKCIKPNNYKLNKMQQSDLDILLAKFQNYQNESQ